MTLDHNTVQWTAAALFGLALLHTFSTSFFAKLSHNSKHHSGFWHLMAEVEVVFGFWAFVLIGALAILVGTSPAVEYLESRNYTEPLFVFVIMVVAASRPILVTVQRMVQRLAQAMPTGETVGVYWLCLCAVPLFGSLITEPAAMTLAALMLKDRFFRPEVSRTLRYATLGVLFVNISIGGTLTNFAAPPVLMVAGKWGWDSAFMLQHFGWKAALAVLINASVITAVFYRELKGLQAPKTSTQDQQAMPFAVAAVHFGFLLGVVLFAHHPVVFMGLFLFFLGYTEAYARYQGRLILREALLVAFFLAGLVVLGGLQQWWLQGALLGVETGVLFFLATGLTAITDNAALTYLASLVEGTSAEFKYAVVAGAVTGGGLTVIANAPNPAGLAILKGGFEDQAVNPLHLLLAALLPTAVAGAALWLL